ncbi:TIGR04222 domain-containing membrane protein [Streptomyces sp. NPDC059696]|uniref:TIGR04222 domain-containing membrane protein n=1 Tax=Streptomyces sp. NPDC059696 TaxID=3346911 RepID=UPI0036A84F3C
MGDGTAVRLEPHEIALLGEGPRAAVTVAVVDLYLRGLVEPGPPGTVRALVADGVVEARPPSPLAAAVHTCLREPTPPKALVKDPDVRLAVALMRIPLAEAGLLRYPLLGATRAARRHVLGLRQEHPLPASRHGLSDPERLLLVALHGEAALRLLVARFALRAGLVRRAEVGGKSLLKNSPRDRGGGGGGYHYCGGGGGGCGGGG